MSEATITLVGNLTNKPRLEQTTNGVHVAHFTVAVTERRRKGENWVNGETSFIECTAWRDLATNATATLARGDRVLVTGEISTHSWQTNTGSRISTMELTVNDLGPSLRWVKANVERKRHDVEAVTEAPAVKAATKVPTVKPKRKARKAA